MNAPFSETVGEILNRRLGRDRALEAATADLIRRLRADPPMAAFGATKDQLNLSGGPR